MKKTLFLILSITIAAICCRAQQKSFPDIKGRWRYYRNGGAIDMFFLTDSTAAVVSPKGLVFFYFDYKIRLKKEDIYLKLTYDIHGKHRSYYTHGIRFINDSTMLYRPGNKPIAQGADSSTKGIRVYKKLKEAQTEQLHLPVNKDLIGSWKFVVRRDSVPRSLIFQDEEHVKFNWPGDTNAYTYRTDFTKQPAVIDFYRDGYSVFIPAFLELDGANLLRIEFFPNNNRGDHFTTFGRNIYFFREKTRSDQ